MSSTLKFAIFMALLAFFALAVNAANGQPTVITVQVAGADSSIASGECYEGGGDCVLMVVKTIKAGTTELSNQVLSRADTDIYVGNQLVSVTYTDGTYTVGDSTFTRVSDTRKYVRTLMRGILRVEDE